jgi:hypothetical protein
MKKQFPLKCRTQLEHEGTRERAVLRGRWYRRIGRIFLLGAALSGGVEMTYAAVLGGPKPAMTLRAMLDLSPSDITRSDLASMQAPIALALDSPLWLVLLIAAAIPYTMAVHQFINEMPRR